MKFNSHLPRRQHPTRRAGFTLVEIMTVMGIVGLLATIAIPNFVRARSTSQKNICIQNLNKIEWAKQNWGLEHSRSGNDIPNASDLIEPIGYLKTMPSCPSGGDYDFLALKDPAVCTIEGHTL